MYGHGLIGNCQVSALVNEFGGIDWLCLPRPDSEPVFGRILDPDAGHFTISSASQTLPQSSQHYLENTCVLQTTIETAEGAYRITDFCARFEQNGRMNRPMALFRIIEPLRGINMIRIECKPISGWDKTESKCTPGNNELRFDIRGEALRAVTNMPLTYLHEGTTFQLSEKIYFALTWAYSVEEDLAQMVERYLLLTCDYWKTWVKHCSIPTLFQKETIRSALTLKLHCYEDTGAILAGLTTSLPEQLGGERNWDYRYCWLRDAYFVLSAFHRLGHFEEMEKFLKFLLNIALTNEASRERLAPVYTLSQTLPTPEILHAHWAGYSASRPVRSNNQASEHVQNDVYGEMILTLTPIFFDERFLHLRTPENEDLLAHLARLCVKSIGSSDAGLWERRAGWQEHTFTNLMSWAGLDRVANIQRAGFLRNLNFDVNKELKRALGSVEASISEGSLRNGPNDPTFDASIALAPVLRLPTRGVLKKTIDEIVRTLAIDNSPGFFFRYTRSDDFGHPSSAFVICSFWIAQSLAILGQKDAAQTILTHAKTSANHLGLYAEHYDPRKKLQTGNFPQAYSHVGLINAAFEVSPPWSEVL